MGEFEEKWAESALYAAKMVAFWLFWLLFYIMFDFELTLLCLLMKVAWNTGKK